MRARQRRLLRAAVTYGQRLLDGPGNPPGIHAPRGDHLPGASRAIRVLHCDDSESYRRLVTAMMREHEGIEIVGHAVDHRDCVARAAALRPDVVVLDLDAGRDEHVVTRLREVCQAWLLVLSSEPDLAEDAIAMQADGFVSKTTSFDEIADAILSPPSRAGGRLVVDEAGAARDVHWLARLREATAEDGFVLFAQPIVDLATGAVVQHELLIRMRDIDGSLLAPSLFLPTAERYGLIPAIDRWVITQAARHAAAGSAIQVNLSGSTLADPEIGAYVEHALAAAGAPAALLSFELTETALIAAEELAAAFFDRVHELGCLVALDDFGTGYAGFTYLKRYPVDCLKIDGEFVQDSMTNPASRQVVRAIVQLAGGFGLQTVAECVENAETLELMRELGVGFAQGYYFGRPAPASDVLAPMELPIAERPR